jgi:hypothetical protein
MRLKFHGAQICFDTCGIPTPLVQSNFVNNLRPMQEQADQHESSRRFSSKYSDAVGKTLTIES